MKGRSVVARFSNVCRKMTMSGIWFSLAVEQREEDAWFP